MATQRVQASVRPVASAARAELWERGYQKREDVPVDPELAEQYLAFLKSFPIGSVKRFVEVFESQMQRGPKHIALALWHGLRDKRHMGKLNNIILTALRERKKGDKHTQNYAKVKLSSLGQAQLQYLRHIGQLELANSYVAWKVESAGEGLN
jgi:hypothetical protein